MDLRALPSAGCAPPLGRASLRRRARWLKRFLATVAILGALLCAVVYGLSASGIGTKRLQQEAEAAIRRLAETDVKVESGPAGITLDGSSFLALQVRDLNLLSGDGRPMLQAGSVRFGMRALPLVTGEVRLTSARLSDARIDLAALPSGKGDWAASLRNGQGLIDPDKVIVAVFDGVREALDAVRLDSVRSIRLVNVEVTLPEESGMGRVKIADAMVRQAGTDRIELSTSATVDGRAMTLAGHAAQEAGTRRITDLDVTIEIAGERRELFWPGAGHEVGSGTLRLTGAEGAGENQSRLNAVLKLQGSALDLGKTGLVAGDVAIEAVLENGLNKIDVSRLQLDTGQSSFAFEGSIGPRPARGSPDDKPAYRYDFVSDGSSLSPDDSSEPALKFLTRIAGAYDVKNRRLVADTIAVRSGAGGDAVGMGAVQFAEGKAPGVFLALTVHDMPVSHVKQLWPWMAAGSARQWVLRNLFGGRVTEASLHYDLPPGRLGSGLPPGPKEVFGRFDVESTRFDTAGHIPPVRDAVGRIEFEGTKVRISLDSGTVYMPSGRIAAASNGTLTVDDAEKRPVIGKLDIDVEGEADAIVELASYEPISAMRYVGMNPEDFSGHVTGNVKADIPLQSGADVSKLNWLVALDYTDLGLQREFDGQNVSGANGSIVVDPDKATITANATLNGIPAEISLVEPLKPGESDARSRKVALILDDKLREKMMPGLAGLISGTMKVGLENRPDGLRALTTDLTSTKLTIPWAGWSKGAGIPAQLSLLMKTEGTNTRLSNISLDGKSFSLRGEMQLAGGALSSASFDKVRLNRDDDVAVSIRRNGTGYKVDVSGAVLDARSVIKQFTAQPGGSGKKVANRDAISLTANVARLSGFHGEVLGGFRLDYDATGSRINALKASAMTGDGATVTAEAGMSGNQRTMSMRSANAGAVLRFLDVYRNVQGGGISIALQGGVDGPLRGKIDARDFLVVNEPKLASIVSTTPKGDSRSLNQAVRGDMDTSRVQFERGFTEVETGTGYVKLANGVLRGPLIGTTFQGILYDQNDNMDMTGTFMPAYGFNRIFGELPLVGAILGNGRDRGLIGVTYRLRGNVKKPELEVNPLSVIAPGIFRSIFEYR